MRDEENQRGRCEPSESLSAAARQQECYRRDSALLRRVGEAQLDAHRQAALRAGTKVYTTLYRQQNAAERALERQVKLIEDGRFGPYKHETFEHTSRTARRRRQRNLAIPPERVPRARSPQRRGARDDRGPRLRRLEIQSFGAGAPAARLCIQADRVFGRRSERRPASYVVNDSPLVLQVPGQPSGTRRTTISSISARFRCVSRLPIAQRVDDQARHGARRADDHQRSAEFRG